MSRLRHGAPRANRAAGRWSLVPATEPVEDRESLAEAVADQLLQRWGVVFRDLVVHEGMPLPWRDLQWALRRFEDRGLVRGGRFVAGFSGEQYALPAAVEGLADIRRRPRSGERVVVNACDPLNLTGVIIRGTRIPAVRTNTRHLRRRPAGGRRSRRRLSRATDQTGSASWPAGARAIRPR